MHSQTKLTTRERERSSAGQGVERLHQNMKMSKNTNSKMGSLHSHSLPLSNVLESVIKVTFTYQTVGEQIYSEGYQINQNLDCQPLHYTYIS